MLKLYYAENKYLEIGHLNIDNLMVASKAKHMRKHDYNESETIVELTMPSEVKSLVEFYENTSPTVPYLLYLNSSLTKPTRIAVQKNYSDAISFHDMDINGGGGDNWGNCFETFERPYSSTNETLQLTSIYVSPKSLESNEAEYYYFIRQMIKYEKQIIDDEFPSNFSNLGVKNLSDSILTSPFVLIMNDLGPLGFTVRPGYNWDYLRLNSFVNSANCYRWFTGKLLVPCDNVYIKNGGDGGDGGFTRPAIAYDPRKIDLASLHYNFDGHNTIMHKTKNVPYTLTYDGVSIDSYVTANVPFVQMPERFLEGGSSGGEIKTSLNYKKLFNPGFYTPSFLVATEDDPTKINSYVVSNGNALYFYLQLADFANLSKVCKEKYPDDTYLSDIPSGDINVPAVVVGFTFNIDDTDGTFDGFMRSSVTFRYGYSDTVGKLTGNEYSSLIYNDEVQEFEDVMPNYEFPPDDGINGGSATTPRNGGNGSWSDVDDKTSIDPTASPSSDATAPMPDSIGITGNYTLIKLDNNSMASLAAQSWTESSWLDYISKFQGTSRIGEGITDIKTSFINIAEGPVMSVNKIAGYTLAEPINGKSIYQYSQYSFGSIDIPRYFDSYLDYAPFTEFVLELPFGQPVQIPPEQIVGDLLSIILRVDALTGTALYYISNSNHLICQVPCNCFIDIPFASSEYTQSRSQALANTAISVGKMAYSASTQNYTGLVTSGIETASQPFMSNINQNATRNITEISSGGGPGAIGAMGIKHAVLKISRPYLVMPGDYYNFVGAPSGYIRQLSSCNGYFSISEFYGQIDCTNDEYDEIVSQLRNGVYP